MTTGFVYMTVSKRYKTRCRYIGINNWKRLARPAILQTSLLGKEQLRCLSEGAMCRSNEIRLIAWILLMIIKDDVVRGQPGPNAVALVKGETMLDCVVSSWAITQWTHTSDGSISLSIASGCSVNGNNSDYYRTEQPGGNICRLIIANATMQLAGVYSCFDGALTSYRSLVTVIDPVESVVVYNRSEVVVDDQLNISCSINYNGPTSPAPSLRPVPYWTTSPEQIFTTATYHPSTNVATLVANLKVQKPTVPIFKCNTVFEVIGNTAGYNPIPPPDNLTVGFTTPIDVQYPVLLGKISSEGRNFTNCGISTVVCNGTANPAANYSWVDMEKPEKIIATNQSYNYAVYGHTYGCKATNYIRGYPHTGEANYTVQDQYGITPCKISRTTNMNITGETCSEKKCGCLLDCNMTIHCYSDAYPEPSYSWKQAGITILENSTTLEDASNGIYICVAQNIIEGMPFEAELSVEVVNCTNCSRPPWWVYPTSEEPTAAIDALGSSDVAVYVAVVISVYEIANLISMGFFLAYYNMHTDQNKNENNSNIATSNKKALNNRFPWLEKMLPCMNPSHATAGKKCLGLFLFALITISCGVFMFPILIIIIKKPCCGEVLHESQENSTINLRLDDISGNVSGKNRFPSPPSSLPPAPPSSHGGLVKRQASSSAGPPRSPPPPNKPTPSAVQLPQRPPPLLRPPAMSQPVNREGAMEYAFLPFAMKTNLAPVQYLDEESHYAVLKRV